jgi:hypothetical protein
MSRVVSTSISKTRSQRQLTYEKVVFTNRARYQDIPATDPGYLEANCQRRDFCRQIWMRGCTKPIRVGKVRPRCGSNRWPIRAPDWRYSWAARHPMVPPLLSPRNQSRFSQSTGPGIRTSSRHPVPNPGCQRRPRLLLCSRTLINGRYPPWTLTYTACLLS